MNFSPAPSRINRLVIALLAAFAFVLLSAAPLHAQAGRRETVQNVPKLGDPDKQLRSQEIEAERAQRDPQLIMAEVNEDFSRLRVLDDEIKLVIKAGGAPDYKRIMESSAEIKKRAARLKANIVFPPTPKDVKRQRTDPGDEFQLVMATMDRMLTSFLTNPIFSDTGGLDTQLAARARYDLEDIIRLSDKLRKSADKMQRNAGKP